MQSNKEKKKNMDETGDKLTTSWQPFFQYPKRDYLTSAHVIWDKHGNLNQPALVEHKHEY